jgi:hypothetical protein
VTKKNYVIDPRGKRIEVETAYDPADHHRNGRSRARKEGSFVTIPLAWKDRLFESHRLFTIMVGIELRFLFFKAFHKPFPLTNTAMEKIGVERHAKYRALAELEDLGLIKVEKRLKKSPLITVLECG